MTTPGKSVWVWAFLIGIALVTLTRPLLRRVPAPPPVLATLPAFALFDADGASFESADLEGSAWVVVFYSSRHGSAQDGSAQDGSAQDGSAQDGSPQDGAAQDGAAQDSSAQDGSPHDGSPHDGAARDGSVMDGSIRNGPSTGEPVCQGLMDSMTDLGRRLDAEEVAAVRLLGIDARQDAKPEDLREFGEVRGLVPPRWSLVTGARDETGALADALLAATVERTEPVRHPSGVPSPCRLFLVDGSGGVRGAYRDDTMGLDEVFHRAQHVARALPD